MRRGAGIPRAGEQWAGWAGNSSNPRRMTILQVHDPRHYRVSYRTREGIQEEETSDVYMVCSWSEYKKSQAERRLHRQKIADQTEEMEYALKLAGLNNPRVLLYREDGPMYLDLKTSQAKQLVKILEDKVRGGYSRSKSSLEKVFGCE